MPHFPLRVRLTIAALAGLAVVAFQSYELWRVHSLLLGGPAPPFLRFLPQPPFELVFFGLAEAAIVFVAVGLVLGLVKNRRVAAVLLFMIAMAIAVMMHVLHVFLMLATIDK